jgi:hypothetical protein
MAFLLLCLEEELHVEGPIVFISVVIGSGHLYNRISSRQPWSLLKNIQDLTSRCVLDSSSPSSSLSSATGDLGLLET